MKIKDKRKRCLFIIALCHSIYGFVETCMILIFGFENVFLYNNSGLDGTRGRHSIWRRWGRYQEHEKGSHL
jgi:hypothetical protein